MESCLKEYGIKLWFKVKCLKYKVKFSYWNVGNPDLKKAEFLMMMTFSVYPEEQMAEMKWKEIVIGGEERKGGSGFVEIGDMQVTNDV